VDTFIARQPVLDDAGRERVMDRRAFVGGLLGASVASAASTAAAAPAARPAPRPDQRGGGGRLRTLWWQAPTLLNPHFASGVKDADASRVVHEPLVSVDPDGRLVPILAAELPSVEAGTLGRDGTWVVWRLKRGVVWQDGRPFGPDDVVFNWEYAADPATAAATLGSYREIVRMEKQGDHAVRVTFKAPTPSWYGHGLVGLIPRHLHATWKGVRAREAPFNLRPVGTGPYRLAEFRPGDSVRYELHPGYHVPRRPFFDTLEVKGGGDAVSAARAVLQTGEYDYAWNVQVEDDVLRRLEQGGRGRVELYAGGDIEHILLNHSDPGREVDGERSSAKAPHPILTDPAVKQALALLVDRAGIQEQIYGRLGRVSANYLTAPAAFASTGARWEYSVDKANRLLDAAGWARGAGGVRAKDGRPLRLVFQTSVNAPRQKTQAVIKQSCARAGIEVELKSITPATFFSSDPGNPDTAAHFTADLQMYTLTTTSVDPQRFMEVFCSWEVAARANQWARRNHTRWHSEEYDRLWRAAETEMDAARRAALFVRMNDLLIEQVVVIPVVWRTRVAAVANGLRGMRLSGWSSDFWNLAHWHREG
jgi:peptide/nickel transport system substrate-binding protein